MCAVWRDFEALISAQHLIKAKAHSAEVEQTIKYTPKNKNGNIKLEHKLLLHIMRLIVLWENCAVCAKYSCVYAKHKKVQNVNYFWFFLNSNFFIIFPHTKHLRKLNSIALTLRIKKLPSGALSVIADRRVVS